MPEETTNPLGVLTIVDWPLPGQALLLFVIGWFLIDILVNFITRIMARRPDRAALQAFLASFLRIGGRVLLLIMCMDLAGLPVGSLLATFAALSLALGLAVQDSLTNLAQGVVILFSHPFDIGDYVEIDGISGIVDRVDLIHVVIYTSDRKRIFLANGSVAKAKIINYSASAERRLDLTFTIAATEDIVVAKTKIAAIIGAHPRILKDPAPTIRLNDFAAAGLKISCLMWVNNADYEEVRYDVLEQVQAAQVAVASA